jgi:glycosyltransferase involved in cell wall biosynthesis
MKNLKILALNPFHGGAHKAFIDGWIKRSEHDWTLLTLVDSNWKWRLQFAAVEFAEQVNRLWEEGQRWDVIFSTSMMNVAEFRAMTPNLRNIPYVVYFHENQLTYPESHHMKFDLSLCMINIKSALAADKVWFNSAFHRDDLLHAAEKLLKPKPDSPVHLIDQISFKSEVQYQAIDDDFLSEERDSSKKTLRILWAARWELDKNPELLFKALRQVKEAGVEFELNFLGEEMHTSLSCIQEAKEEFKDEIRFWGYVESREEYINILKEADIFVSTANHEFFGIAAVEAVAAGCSPILPSHQSYPEVLKGFEKNFYKPGSAKQLAEKIMNYSVHSLEPIKKYLWSQRAPSLDNAILAVASHNIH